MQPASGADCDKLQERTAKVLLTPLVSLECMSSPAYQQVWVGHLRAFRQTLRDPCKL